MASETHLVPNRGLRPVSSLVIGMLLTATGLVSLAGQPPDDGLAAIQRLLRALVGSLSLDPNESVVLLDRTVTVDPWLAPMSDEVQKFVSELVNRVPHGDSLFRDSNVRVASTYQRVLDEAVWGKLRLSQAEATAQREALGTLYSDPAKQEKTPGFRLYESLKARYEAALKKWEGTPEAERTQQMRTEMESAEADFELRGDRAKYEGALETIESLREREPDTYKQRLMARFRRGGNTATVVFSPPLDLDSTATSWLPVSSADPSTSKASRNELAWPEAYGGLWRFCESSSGNAQQLRSAVQQLSLSLDVRTVRLDRPWLDVDLFEYTGWRLDTPPTMVSEPSNRTGRLPLLITGVLVGKNLQIRGKFPSSERERLKDAVRRGACSSFGPFATSGPMSLGDGHVTVLPNRDGFNLPDVHLVGFVVRTVPRSPQPSDSRYAWPGQGGKQ